MRLSIQLALAVALLCSPLPALAVSGTVHDGQGAFVDSVRVCQFQQSTARELMCVGTREDGYFELPDAKRDIVIRISAPGYFGETIPPTGHTEVILRPAPTLIVKLVDSKTAEAIAEGEVFVIYTSGAKKGPFPVNRAGVRISRILEGGDIRVLARAEGYSFGGEQALTLEPGEERLVTIELSPLEKD